MCAIAGVDARPTSNPPNSWHSSEVEYLEGIEAHARLSVYEDHTRNILSTNGVEGKQAAIDPRMLSDNPDSISSRPCDHEPDRTPAARARHDDGHGEAA